MFSRTNHVGVPRLAGQFQSVRNLRKRTPEYPAYRATLAPLTNAKKDHSGYFSRHMKAWLGPRNLQGEYHENKYYYVPQNNVPNYIVPDGVPLVSSTETPSYRGNNGRDPTVNPFPQNPHCKTASIVSDDLKRKIHSAHVEKGILTQELAHKFGMKISRIEALIRLQTIEDSWKEQVCLHY